VTIQLKAVAMSGTCSRFRASTKGLIEVPATLGPRVDRHQNQDASSKQQQTGCTPASRRGTLRSG
jgi:hypothetical protein